MAQLRHLTVHVYDVCTTLNGIRSVAARLVDVVAGTLSALVSHGVGIHHSTIHLHRSVVLRHNETVAVAQHEVGVRARILHSLCEVDTYRVLIRHLELLDVGLCSILGCSLQSCSVVGTCRELQKVLLLLLLLHLQYSLHTCLLGFVSPTHESCALYVGESVRTARLLEEVAQACVVALQSVGSGEEHLALYRHVLLLGVARRTHYVHFVKRHKCQRAVTVNSKVVFQRHAECLCDDAVWTQRLRVAHTSANAHVHERRLVGETASLYDEVLNSLVVGVLIYTGILHLATYRERSVGHLLCLGSHKEHVVLLQWDVGYTTAHNALDVYADHLKSAVCLHAVHHGTRSDSIFCNTVGVLDERTYAVHLLAEVIHTRTEHGSLHLHGVGVACHD